MTRPMTPEDLGDIRALERVFEDEAIREQAARLQIHMENLIGRVSEQAQMSRNTQYRIWRLWSKCSQLNTEAGKIYYGSETQ